MATEADIREHVAETFREEKDREMLTEASNVVVDKSEGKAEPLPKFEVQVTKEAIEVNARSTEGEYFYESPSVAKVADEQILSPSELNEAAVVLNETESKFSESSIGKETENNDVDIFSTIKENSAEEIQHISKETSSGCDSELNGKILPEDKANISVANPSQTAEGKFFEPDLAEEMNVIEPASSKEDVSKATFSEEGLGHTISEESENVFILEEKNTDPEEMKSRANIKDEDSKKETTLCDATEKANMKSENPSDQNEEATEICENGNRHVDISSTVTPVEDTCISNAGSDDTYSEATRSSDALENEHIVEAEASTGKPLASSTVASENVTHNTAAKPNTEVDLGSTEASIGEYRDEGSSTVADEVQTEVEAIRSSDALEYEHIVEAEASTEDSLSSSTVAPENVTHKTEAKPNSEVDLASTEGSRGEYRDEDRSTVADEVQTEVEEPRKFKDDETFPDSETIQISPEEPLYAAPDKIDVSESCQSTETTTNVVNLPEALKEATKDETLDAHYTQEKQTEDISTDDLKEDDDDIPSNTVQDLQNTPPLVDETKQEQVFEENQVPISEPRHVYDAHEANSIPECSTIMQTLAEGESDTGFTSTGEIDTNKLETESKSNSAEELQINAENNAEDRLQQHGEAFEEQNHENPNAIENTIHESETTDDASSVTISEEAGLQKEEPTTHKLRLESLNEMQDESAIAAKDKECEAEETSEVQPEQYVHEIPSSDSQSIENDKSVETGAEKTFTGEHSLNLQSSKKDVDDSGNSLQIAEEIQPVNVGKEYSEASHFESEKVEKILEPATQVHNSEVSYEIEESGMKGESLEAATPQSGVEKILNEEANGTTENYISSEKNISIVDLNEDDDGDISSNTAKDLHSNLPLVEETKEEQVFEDNQVLIEEPKHDAHEANSPESSTFGQTWAEEASEMELTSTSQMDADEIETNSKLNFTKKLQIDAENNTEEKLQQPGEAFEEHDHETPNAMENTIHESETNVDPSSVASSEKACSHKEEFSTPESRFKSFEEIQDESGIEVKEKENEAEETSEVQLERSVHEIQVSESQSVGNDKSIENGAEKTFTDERSLISESSKKDIDDLSISHSTENEVLPEEAGKEYAEASHHESEKLEKVLDRAPRVHYSDYEAEGSGIKEESLEAATTKIGAEKILHEETNEAKGTTESYISSEKNITTVDLNDEEDGDIPCYTPKDLQSTIPLVGETKQEQVCEENEVPIEELKHVHDAHETISIPESSTIHQTLAEGDLDVDLASTSQVDADNLEAEFKLNSTEKLQTNAENNTGDQLQQHGKASEEQDHKTLNAIENTIHESETTVDASSVTIPEEAGLEGASLLKEESSTPELRSKSLEEMEDGRRAEAKEKEYEAEATSEVQPPQDVHETQFSDSQSVGDDKSVETGAEKTLTDDTSLSSESSKKDVDDLAITHPTDNEILPEEVGKEYNEVSHIETEKEKFVESVTQVDYSEEPSELEESEMKEESLEAARTEKENIQEELPSISTHVISDTEKSDNQSEVFRDQESTDEGSTANSTLHRSLGEEETERVYTDEAPKELNPEEDFDGLDKCSNEEVLSSEVVSLQHDQEYPIEENSQAHNPNISDPSVVDIPGAEGRENAVSEADREGLLHKPTKESEIREISSTAVETNEEVAIIADNDALESLMDHEKPDTTKPVETACEEKEATEKSLPTEKAEDKELETDVAKDEEEEREVQKGEYSTSEVTPMVERDLVDVTSDKIITEVETKEDNSNVVPDDKNLEQGDPKESTETAISSEDKRIQSDSVTGTVGLEIDEPIPVDSSEAAGSNINEEAKEYIEDQTTHSFELAQSNKSEAAIENNEGQATEIFEAARSDNHEEVTAYNEDQATIVATRDSETKLDESDSQSSITEGEEPKIHDRDVKLENLSPPDQSNTDICQIDEHLDPATPTEIAPESIELQNASLATKEIGILEESQTIESTEATTISAGKDVELLQKDLAATIIQDEIQTPKTENDPDSASEVATVDSEAKDASDEFKEMEQESSIIQAKDSEPDLIQGPANTTLSVAEERGILDQLSEDHVSEHVNDHVELVQKDLAESTETVISDEEKNSLLVQPISVTGTIAREAEELHANASETQAEAERVESGEEQGTIHDYHQIPESSQSTDSTKSPPSDLLQGSADETIQKVEDIDSQLLQAPLLPSHEQIELEADQRVTYDLESSMSDKDVPQMEEEAATELVQTGGEISGCAEQSSKETKSEDEQRTIDEIKDATVKATNTAASEEETLEITEHSSDRSEQIAKNEELQIENAERDENRELKTDEAKDEEEEREVQKGEYPASEVTPMVAEVEIKEDNSSDVRDEKNPEQGDPEKSTETVISSEDKHSQSDSVTGTVALEIDELKHADSSEAAGTIKSEEAKENNEVPAADSSVAAGSNENEEPKENNEDQATVETRGSETKQNENDTQSNITEGDDLKIHVPDVKLENLSPPQQSSTNICDIDEPLDLEKPSEIAPEMIEIEKASLSTKETGISEEPPSSESTEIIITSLDKDVDLLQTDEMQKAETENVPNAASEAVMVEPEATCTTDESKETDQESTSIKTTINSEPDLVQGSENQTLSVAEERETLDQLAEDNVNDGLKDPNTGIIQKEEQANLSSDENTEINVGSSFEVSANQIPVQKDPEESSEPVLCSGDEDMPRLEPVSVTAEEAKGEEAQSITDEINEVMVKSPPTKIADTSATSEEETLAIAENAERSEDKEVKTDEREEGEVQRRENSRSEVPLMVEKDSVDLTNNKIITAEMKEDNSIVVPEKTIPMQGEPEENTETLISREVPFMVTRAVNLENEELKHVNASEPAAETESLECEEDTRATRDYNEIPESFGSMEPSKSSPYENLQASATVTPVEAEAIESQDTESLHVPPHSKSSMIENLTKDSANDINITRDKQEPEAAPHLASSEHIVHEADQKATPEPGNSESVAQVQQEATSESYQEVPEPAKIKEETKEATEKSLPTETANNITSEKAEHANEGIKVVPEKEELQVKIAERDEYEAVKTDEKEEGENSGEEAPVIVEASRDVETKVSPKKSNNILSGVGSKVKHSIAKVKKAITGKHSHSKESKPPSPK